ncbi:MAG: hypothetical protein GIW95_08170 [Candidatus Eremiobacteraeota bacterium]|nr:hypothetical protein [Candidatus Eremiobacteraeota bacterium]
MDSERRSRRLFDGIFADGFALMRERWMVYGAMMVACGISAATVYQHASLLKTFATGDLGSVVRSQPLNIVLMSALVAIFFVLPSALRKLDTKFRMTTARAIMTVAMIVCVGVATDLGYAAAFIPGIVIGVLMSQALINALLRTGEGATMSGAFATIYDSMRGSVTQTRSHFATTFGVLAASLAILGIPFFFGLCAMLVLDVIVPRSLILTAPLLFAQFIYCECVRYALIVRWYRRLDAEQKHPILSMVRAA